MSYTPGTYGLREDLYDVTLTIKSAKNPSLNATYTIDKLTGGGAKSKDSKYRPGNGTETQLSLGGPKEIDNANCTALFNSETMNEQTLLEAAGKAAVELKRTPLNEEGELEPAKQTTYMGKLLDFTPPPTDTESEKAATVEFVLSLTSAIT
jgi:hypothetical protein